MYTSSLETFLAVVRCQSLSRAAEELNIAQTTVSQRLKILEQEFGINLIERRKGIKQMRLTSAGEEFLKLAEQWNIIWHEAKLLQTHEPNISLTIGTVDSINMFLLPPIYRDICKHDPGIKLEIRTSHSIDLYAEVEKRRVDVAYVLRDLVHPSITVTKCFSSPMVVYRLAGDQQQGSSSIHPSELDPNYELSMPWGTEFRAWHDHWFHPLPTAKIRLDNIKLLFTLIELPEQWAIVPLWIANAAIKQKEYFIYTLLGSPPDYTCYKLVHKSPTTASKRAIAILDNYFEKAVTTVY